MTQISSDSPTSSNSSSASSRPGSYNLKDPIFRNALRYTVSPREYELLHKYLLTQAPTAIERHAPRPKRYDAIAKHDPGREYNISTVRAALRVFIAVYAGFKGWDFLLHRFLKTRARFSKGTDGRSGRLPSSPMARAVHARVAACFSLMVLFHRLLFRFLTRLRAAILDSPKDGFQARNPRITALLTSIYTPAIGGSLSTLFLGVLPSSTLRKTIAIYILSRGLESSFDFLEYFRYIFPSGQRPSLFGSWLLLPFSFGQMLHTFVYNRECFPSSFGSFILRRSPGYVHPDPPSTPSTILKDRLSSNYTSFSSSSRVNAQTWPKVYDVVDALAFLSRNNWPTTLFSSSPNMDSHLASPTIDAVRPLLSLSPPSNPTSCALLHPQSSSCIPPLFEFFSKSLIQNLRFFSFIIPLISLPSSIRRLQKSPALLKSLTSIAKLLASTIFKLSLFTTSALGLAWSSICFFATYFRGRTLSQQRFYIGGFLGGLCGMILHNPPSSPHESVRKKTHGVGSERTIAMSFARMGMLCYVKVLQSRYYSNWWVQRLDVLSFTIGWMVLQVLRAEERRRSDGGDVKVVLGSSSGMRYMMDWLAGHDAEVVEKDRVN